MELFRPDKPVTEQADDQFQRYEFARRISAIIDKARYGTSLVIGVYGKWGEGKSSILNFVSKELNPETIQINFNPWYFRDETQLINNFFKSVGDVLGKKLTSKKKAVSQAVSDYSSSLESAIDLLPWYLKIASRLTTKVASKFSSSATLLEQKKRIENFIIEANTNIVVFIDDIDRLSVTEIQSVFKLVKLVGEFPRIAYVLAFDNELIASALGRQFGKGEQANGYDYLEKIVQVPLQLPKAHKSSLRKFSLELIDKAIQDSSATLTPAEASEFVQKFDTAFLPALDNPRLAIRLSNSIAFSVPLVYQEVRLSDLLIIECIKVFYPNLYYYIRENSKVFLRSYSSRHISENGRPEFKKSVQEKLETVLSEYDENLQEPIKDMLTELFPNLKGLFGNHYMTDRKWEEWYRDQKICSMYYFDRYFSYVVKKGDISDVYFSELLIDITQHTYEYTGKRLCEELIKVDTTDFIFKLQIYTQKLTRDEATPLILALGTIGDSLPQPKVFSFFSTHQDVAITARDLIKKLDRAEWLTKSQELLKVATPYDFALQIYSTLTHNPKDESIGPFLNSDEETALANTLIELFEAKIKVTHFASLSDTTLRLTFYVFKLTYLLAGEDLNFQWSNN
jgi:predicted KAP-like P-loop ATPase